MNVRHVENSIVKIDEAEALRYLGCKNKEIDEETNRLLKESIAELQEISRLRYVYEIFAIEKENNNISFENKINIKSDDLSKLFMHCDNAAIMAATIGFEAETKIKYYSVSNLSKAVVFDACAASCIEALCDMAEAEIKAIAEDEGCRITYRYSPGYGDVSVSHQGEILSALNAQRLIGLTASDSSILIPRKSVTAFIGFDKSNTLHEKSCLNCNLMGNCIYRGRRNTCVK